MKIGFIAAFMFCASVLSAQVNPKIDAWLPPKPNNFVVDSAHVLSPDAIRTADSTLRSLYELKHAPSVVVTLTKTHGLEPYEVATEIGRYWGVVTPGKIGDQTRNYGLVLLVVPKETSEDGRGHCWLAVSKGMEGTVTDASAGDFCRSLVP